MDHIVNHLKIYAQNSAEFRAAIGEHRMGKVQYVNLVYGAMNGSNLINGAVV